MAFGSWLKYIEIKCWSLEVLTHYSMRCGSTWWNVEHRPATSTNIQKREKGNRIHWYSLAIPVPWGKWNRHPLHGMVEWPWSLLNGDHHCQIIGISMYRRKPFQDLRILHETLSSSLAVIQSYHPSTRLRLQVERLASLPKQPLEKKSSQGFQGLGQAVVIGRLKNRILKSMICNIYIHVYHMHKHLYIYIYNT